MLNGHLPWQLQGLFKIKLQNENGAFIECRLPLALTTIPEISGKLDCVSKFVQVRQLLDAVALPVFTLENIFSCAHLIPEITTSGKTGDGCNE